MNRHTSQKTSFLHFSVLLMWILVMFYTQANLLHSLPKLFQNIDLVSTAMLCIFFVNSIWVSVFLACIAGGLLDSFSGIRPGFFVLYFFISIIVIQSISRFFVLHNLGTKFIVFVILFLLKFLFIYFMLDDDVITIANFVANNVNQFFIPVGLFFIMMQIIQKFKNRFDNPDHFERSYF